MPLAGYLGLSFEHSQALRSMTGPIRAYLKMLDHAPRGLRESGLNPYLIVAIKVPDAA
jgi:hypothetical protein